MNSTGVRLKYLRIVISTAVSLMIAFCMAGIAGTTAFAHPAPSVVHDYLISLSPESLKVTSYLRISPELVPEVYRQLDSDGDGKTSEAEHQAWIGTHLSMLQAALDGTDVPLTLNAPVTLSKEDLLVSSSQPVVATYTFKPEKSLSGKRRIRLTYGDNYLTYDEYYVSVAGDLVNDRQPVGIARPLYPATYQVIYQMPDASDAQTQSLAGGELAPAPWSATASQPAPQTQSQDPAAQPAAQDPVPASPQAALPYGNQSTGPIAQLLDTLRNWRGEIWTALGMLALVLVIGALHALTPGHGKAMVAAYLVGSRGRVKDAVLLGAIVTCTHTIGVMILGVALLVISNFAMPRALTPALELASGLLVMLLGAYLLVRRWTELRKASSGQSERPHSHLQVSDTAMGGSTLALAVSASSLPVRPANGGQYAAYTSAPGTLDNRYHSHEGLHSHSHDHIHPHSHMEKPEGLRALIGLGVSGGLVPCPDALAILLLAAGVGQFALGISLVVSFSLGLAGVLIAIGVALVKMKGILERTRNGRLVTPPIWSHWIPLISAAVVVIVGVLMLLSSLNSPWS